MTRGKGFTLVELMITLLVASILLGVAVPSYRRYVMRSQRTDATTALMRIQAAQEKFFLQYNTYATNLNDEPPAGLGLAEISDGGFYDLDLEADAMEFRVSATPHAGTRQADDERCQQFEIDHTGVKRAKDGSGTDRTGECWR
jgi:type IV pilus assembly protein PilE